MTRLTIVDFVGSPGGGVRFTVELLAAIEATSADVEATLVSHGNALARYRELLGARGLRTRIVDVRPGGFLRAAPNESRFLGIPGTWRLKRLLGFGQSGAFDVPPAALEGADVIWLPWMHRHRVPVDAADRTVASFHDTIWFDFPGETPGRALADEREVVRGWLASSAGIVVSARTTVASLGRLFGAPPDRFSVVPLTGAHAAGAHAARAPGPPLPDFARAPFLLCPANLSPHKNHEVLLRGVGAWGARHPLLLTGHGADFRDKIRSRDLRAIADASGLVPGDRLHALGYVSNETYAALLARAWALVMPTLAEGGGSFPVYEAMLAGVPVACSDIPVLREQLERTGGDVLWFRPDDAGSLAARLEELSAGYDAIKARAVRQAAELRAPSWADVARDYLRIFACRAERRAAIPR